MKNGMIICLIILSSVFGCKNQTDSNHIIKIGAIQQLSTKMAKYGLTQLSALYAMRDIINEDRLENNLPRLEILGEDGDDQLEPSKGVSIIEKYISINKVVAVIGAQGSSVTLAIAPIAEKNKIVLISGGSTTPKITDSGNYIFRTCPSDFYEGEYIANLYDGIYPNESVAILYINNDYGVGLRDAFKNKIKSKPIQILELGYSKESRDFRNQISIMIRERIKVVYVVGYDEMVTIFKQAKELGLKCNWLGNNQLNDQFLITKIDNSVNGLIFPGNVFNLKMLKSTHSLFYSKFLEYVNELKLKYPKILGDKNKEQVDLDVFAAYAADALIVINSALLNGAKTGEDIKNYLLKIKNFEGVTGKFSFDNNGDAIRTLTLYQIQDGKMNPYKLN